MRDAFMKESKIKEEEIGKIIQNEDWWIYEKIRIEEMEIRKRQKALWFKRHEHEEKIGNDIEEEGPLSNSISDWEMVREKEKNHKGSDAEKRICWGGYKLSSVTLLSAVSNSEIDKGSSRVRKRRTKQTR